MIAHAQSDVEKPEIQGMWGIAEIFVDTILVCTVTALVLLVSGVYRPEICIQNFSTGIENIDGTTFNGEGIWKCDSVWRGTALYYLRYFFALATMIGLVVSWRADCGLSCKRKRNKNL